MKTTIDLPEEILHSAKIVAAQRRTTLKELVITGLNHAISACAEDEELKRRQRAEIFLSQNRAENSEPMTPLSREEIHDR